MALDGVKCTVSSCHYWTAPNNCDAPKIEVDVNHTGLGAEQGGRRGSGRMEIGEVGGYREGTRGAAGYGGELDLGAAAGGVTPAGRAEARRSEHTCCRTFRPRG